MIGCGFSFNFLHYKIKGSSTLICRYSFFGSVSSDFDKKGMRQE